MSINDVLTRLERDPLLGNLMLPGQIQKLFECAQKVPDGGLILEIGSFLGASSIALALGCLGTSKRVICVDTFEGNSTDFVKGNNNVWWNGNSYLPLFSKNLERYGVQNVVVPVVGNSGQIAVDWHQDLDLLFIDGDHTIEGCTADLFNYVPFLRNNGLLLIHDVLPDREHLISVCTRMIEHNMRKKENFKGLEILQKTTELKGKQWILIPTYRETKVLKRLLIALDPNNLVNKEVVLIDDGADTQLKTFICEQYPQVKYIVGNGENFWGGSLDLGLNAISSQRSDEDVVFLVNADGLVTDHDLNNLLSVFQNQPFGNTAFGFSGKIEGSDTIVDNGGYIDWSPQRLGRGAILDKTRRKANLVMVDAIFGRASIFPAKLFNSLGMRFRDTGFNHYWSDTAFCLDAYQLHQTAFYIDATHTVAIQEREIDKKTRTIIEAYQDCFQNKKPSNYNIKNRIKFIRKYFPGRNPVSASYYYSILSVLDSFKNVPFLSLPIRFIRFFYARRITRQIFYKMCSPFERKNMTPTQANTDKTDS
ncbi:MAG: class I SAM-dependent methyltransferase [Pseudomonadota bacterium]|nr:class I SAM-dependent methyltransferase [Pseudomonadota bacterium]